MSAHKAAPSAATPNKGAAPRAECEYAAGGRVPEDELARELAQVLAIAKVRVVVR